MSGAGRTYLLGVAGLLDGLSEDLETLDVGVNGRSETTLITDVGGVLTVLGLDDSLEVVEIPENTYAVFACRGKMPESFTDTYKKIVTEFFPQNPRYEYGRNVELEVCPSDDVDNPNYYCEIWIAVNER